MQKKSRNVAAFLRETFEQTLRGSAPKDDHERATFVVHRKKMVTIYK